MLVFLIAKKYIFVSYMLNIYKEYLLLFLKVKICIQTLLSKELNMFCSVKIVPGLDGK